MKILLLSLSLASSIFAGESIRPLENQDGWSFGDRNAWSWSSDAKVPMLSLTKQSVFKPKVRSPFNLAWYTAKDWQSFTLTVDARLTKFDQGNNDLCIAFARQDDTHFYYAHLGEKSDEVHNQIHLVNNADRKPITLTRGEGIPWKEGTWHKLKLTHDTATGKITVWFDDMTQPVLTAEDKTLSHGQIGIGSFDDLGEFRNLEIKEGL